jgi:hypothetical protein
VTTQDKITKDRGQIRQGLGEGLTIKQAIEKTGLPVSTFYRRLKQIRDLDQQTYSQQNWNYKSFYLRQGLEKLMQHEDAAISIANNPDIKVKDRIKAVQTARQTRADIYTLLTEGPTKFRTLVSANNKHKDRG